MFNLMFDVGCPLVSWLWGLEKVGLQSSVFIFVHVMPAITSRDKYSVTIHKGQTDNRTFGHVNGLRK